MNFRESEAYLLSLGNEVSAMKLGLESIGNVLGNLGNPQNKYLKLQVAGTNGKGSVCAFLDAICRSAGIRTGLYTSPHLVSITERIKISGRDISEEDFARHATIIREISKSMAASGELESVPTFFEQVTAIALNVFAETQIELAILETGLGGRLDATTAARAEIAAITRIDYDHQRILGVTIEEIAAEKAAIIRPDSRVVIGMQQNEVMAVLLEHCERLGIVPTTFCETHVWAVDMINKSWVVSFRTDNDLYYDSDLGLKGRHQVENARIATMLADMLRFEFGLRITKDHVDDGLENAFHPGRLEYIGEKYLLDGAHNVGAARALVEYLDEFEKGPITMIYGTMRDKDVGEIAKILFPRASEIILTSPENSRAMPAAELRGVVPKSEVYVRDSADEALTLAETVSKGLILVTGSLYLIGDVRKLLKTRGLAS